MRTAFINELIAQARLRPDIFLVVGDIGFSVVEPFAAEFPERFLNAGVAEQNMTGVAAGLASEGYYVFTYSIANFPTLRCLEQIRNDVAHCRSRVTVVAVGAGLSYGNLGYSHHAVQDIGVMRTMPELTILSPADPGETRECVQWLVEHPCPSYLRLGKAGEPHLHSRRGIPCGPLEVLRGRSDCAIVSSGSILSVALEASSKLAQVGVDASVFSCPWLQPATAAFFAPLARFNRLVVLEEHVAAGGLASLLREQLDACRITSLAVPGGILNQVGSQAFLRRQAGLTAEAVVEALVGSASCTRAEVRCP
jgi:transketolase